VCLIGEGDIPDEDIEPGLSVTCDGCVDVVCDQCFLGAQMQWARRAGENWYILLCRECASQPRWRRRLINPFCDPW